MLTAPYFRNLEHALKAQAKASGLLGSSTGKGRAREDLLARFFANHIPSRVAVVRGEIVDSNGSSTGETDLVFADRNSPAFGIGGEMIVPVEAAIGTCEVKSSLAGEHLRQAVEKIRDVKRLQRGDHHGFHTRSRSATPRIPIPPRNPAGYVISFQAPSLETIIENLRRNPEWFDGDVMARAPEMICVLERGMILKNDFHIFGGPDAHSTPDFFIIEDAVGLQKLLGHVNETLARYGQLTYEVIQYYMDS